MSSQRSRQVGTVTVAGRTFDCIGAVPPAPRLAIVGSRAARREVVERLPLVLRACADLGWSLVSGGALGIDAAAHEAALDLGVPQVAVLPCGADRRYPHRNLGLFARIERAPHSGLLFARVQGAPFARSVFAGRNRIVVELADAVLVAQAGLPSGSHGTGRLGIAGGRSVAVFAGSAGCASLVADGAHVLAASRPEPNAVMAWLGAVAAGEPPRRALARAWPDHLEWLRSALESRGPGGCVVDRLPDPLAAVCALVEAEGLDLVEELAPGRWMVKNGRRSWPPATEPTAKDRTSTTRRGACWPSLIAAALCCGPRTH